MTKDQILQIANDSGLTDKDLGDWMTDYGYSEESITRFASAIRAATKEEDARICWDRSKGAPEAYAAEAMLCAAHIRASK